MVVQRFIYHFFVLKQRVTPACRGSRARKKITNDADISLKVFVIREADSSENRSPPTASSRQDPRVFACQRRHIRSLDILVKIAGTKLLVNGNRGNGERS